MSGLATRLYQGEAGINVVGRRKRWFVAAGAVLLIAVLGFVINGFTLGIEFRGGNQLNIPASVGSMAEAREAVEANGGEVVTTQELSTVGGGTNSYQIRIAQEEGEKPERLTELKDAVAKDLGVQPGVISDSRVSAAWGGQVIRQALISLAIFIAVVVLYLVIRFEWRMAVAAVASLILDLILAAGVYALSGFEVTPSTVIGFLTILGFALYDVVVVFDKVQENTRGITGSSVQTYEEAANLAVNQTLMRSINTGLVALLPVGGLLFIGAGLLGAGTLKDLGLVLFIGMGAAVTSSIFFATPVLVELKNREPKYKAHTQRVLARRAGGGTAKRAGRVARSDAGETAGKGRGATAVPVGTGAGGKPTPVSPAGPADVGDLAATSPRPGARPGAGKRAGNRGGRPGGGRPGGTKRR